MEQNNEIKEELSSNQIIFNVTENIKKLGISQFSLQREFLITWSNGRNSCIGFNFKSSSLSQNIKLIENKLKKEVRGNNIDDETFDNAIKDIEDQLIKRKDEIFNLNKTKTSEDNSLKEFLEDVSKLREHFTTYPNPLLEWQSQVCKKYQNLENTVNRIYPNMWSIMQFTIAIKTVLNIEGNKLPFLGIIIALPSSLKTTFLNYYRIYHHSFYSDSFTPNSLVSHNSALTKEQLKKDIDMLPKIKDKLVLVPEMAPLFTAKEEDLHKILGIIIRLLDGDGLESDSGAHGHRGYPPTMFSWIGAVVEIPPKVWKILSQLGFKIYFFRPDLPEKSIDDLVNIALDREISKKNQEIKDALLDYLKVFDAAPITDVTSIDENENGIVKVKWNAGITRNDEQYQAIEYIAKIAKLLASLRGDVFVYQNKSRQSTRQDISDGENELHPQQVSYHTEQLDYETDSVIIEDPSRATIQLRNLALANAISQGRNYIKNEDVKLVVKVALSTTRVTRKKVFDLLLKEKGELTTSKIVNELGLSEPTARKTMREFQALGLANISSTSGYINSELTLVLNKTFKWFLSEEFESLRDEKAAKTISINQFNTEYRRMYLPIITKTLSNSYTVQKACDSNCHTLKANSPPETDIKNDYSKTSNKVPYNDLSTGNENPKTDNSKKIKQEEGNTIHNSLSDERSIKENNTMESLNPDPFKNSASLGPENFQHVTPSHDNCHTELVNKVINEIYDIIKTENVPISLGYALQLACQRSEVVKDYLKYEKKLTARDSRKVRNLLVKINRLPDIHTVKRKPELVVKWIEGVTVNN